MLAVDRTGYTNAEKMLGLSLDLIFVVVLWAQGGCAQNLSAFLTPLAFNASQGSETTFHCSVTGADTLLWRVDNEIIMSPSSMENNRGIRFTQPVAGIFGSFQSNLTIPATPENDGSVVQCVAAMIPGSNVLSSTASYRVQGLLDPPINLTIVNQDVSRSRLLWGAPESLDITDIEPDISNYRICTNLSGVCIKTTELEHVFPNVRIPIEFSVTAVNIVGESNASITIYEPCDPTTEPESVNGSDVRSNISFQALENPVVTFSFLEVSSAGSTNCLNVYTVETTPVSSMEAVMHGPLIPRVTDASTLIVSIDSNLVPNNVYTATLITVNVQGSVNSTGLIQFTTFDVQEVTVSIGPGTITVVCSFAEGSDARGCHIVISEQNSGEELCRNVTRQLMSGSALALTATHTENNLQPGVYDVSVFDLESDGGIDLQSTVHSQRVDITEPPTLTPTPVPSLPPGITSTVSPPLPSPPPTFEDRAGVNAAVIVPVAVVFPVVVVLVLIIVVVCIYIYQRQQPKSKKLQHSGSENGLVSTESVDGRQTFTLQTKSSTLQQQDVEFIFSAPKHSSEGLTQELSLSQDSIAMQPLPALPTVTKDQHYEMTGEIGTHSANEVEMGRRSSPPSYEDAVMKRQMGPTYADLTPSQERLHVGSAHKEGTPPETEHQDQSALVLYAEATPLETRRTVPLYDEATPPETRRTVPLYDEATPPETRRTVPLYAEATPPETRRTNSLHKEATPAQTRDSGPLYEEATPPPRQHVVTDPTYDNARHPSERRQPTDPLYEEAHSSESHKNPTSPVYEKPDLPPHLSAIDDSSDNRQSVAPELPPQNLTEDDFMKLDLHTGQPPEVPPQEFLSDTLPDSASAQAQKRLQYVELDHQQVRKKGKICDKAAVLYSELKINEPPEPSPAIPAKRSRKQHT